MGVEIGDEVLDLGFVAAELAVGPGPGREVVPARAARGLGVRRDDLDAVLDQVAPVIDALGVALADEEDDGRGIGRRVVGELGAPVGIDLAASS